MWIKMLPSIGSLWALVAIFIQVIQAQSRISDAPGNGTETQTSTPGDIAAENASGASGDVGGNLSTADKIIIGVVVGVVSLLVSKYRTFSRVESCDVCCDGPRED
jgi:hypothetical protein